MENARLYDPVFDKVIRCPIEFAHRNVTVYLPQEDSNAASAEVQGADKDGAFPAPAPDKKSLERAAGAAAGAIQAEEEKKSG